MNLIRNEKKEVLFEELKPHSYFLFQRKLYCKMPQTYKKENGWEWNCLEFTEERVTEINFMDGEVKERVIPVTIAEVKYNI